MLYMSQCVLAVRRGLGEGQVKISGPSTILVGCLGTQSLCLRLTFLVIMSIQCVGEMYVCQRSSKERWNDDKLIISIYKCNRTIHLGMMGVVDQYNWRAPNWRSLFWNVIEPIPTNIQRYFGKIKHRKQLLCLDCTCAVQLIQKYDKLCPFISNEHVLKWDHA